MIAAREMHGGTAERSTAMHIVTRVMFSLSVVCAAALAAACGRSQAEGVTSAQPSFNDPQLAQLASERCDRERACGNIGIYRPYSSRSRCMDNTVRSQREELANANCVSVDAAKLDGCVTWIREQRCDLPLGSLERTQACSAAALCVQ